MFIFSILGAIAFLVIVLWPDKPSGHRPTQREAEEQQERMLRYLVYRQMMDDIRDDYRN